MAKLSLAIIFLFAAFSLPAQTVDKNRKQVENTYEPIKDDFDKEFNNSASHTMDKTVLTYRPAVTLPEWLVSFNANADGKFRSLGISDPGLDSLDALEQATVRALAIASFAHKSKIQNVSDNYYLEHDGNKTLGKFNSLTNYTANDTIGFELIDYDYTSNGEMLVLVDVTKNAPEVFYLNTNIEFYQSETSDKLITRLFFDIDFQDKHGQTIKATWLLKENSKSFDIVSEWDGEPLELTLAKFRYLAPGSAPVDTLNVGEFSFDMKYGLWYAYLNALAVNMEQMEVFNSQVKFLDNKYDRQYQDLTRIVFTEVAAFNISGITIQNNKLAIKLIKD